MRNVAPPGVGSGRVSQVAERDRDEIFCIIHSESDAREKNDYDETRAIRRRMPPLIRAFRTLHPFHAAPFRACRSRKGGMKGWLIIERTISPRYERQDRGFQEIGNCSANGITNAWRFGP